MKLLLDTQVWLWSLAEPERVKDEARALLGDWRNTIYLSAASAWEIAIKSALGKLPLPEAPGIYVPSRMASLGVLPLSITHSHALHVFSLPAYHRDPFDRIIIAQSQVENLPILTADPLFKQYDVTII